MMIQETSKPISEHRRRKHDAMVLRILDTARTIMREQGVAALSMQELARRLDLRASSLYYYFAGKMEIYDTLFRLGFEQINREIEAATRTAESWQVYVRSTMMTYLSFARENPELYQLLFERPVPGFVPSAESLQESTRGLREAYRRFEAFQQEIGSNLTPQQMVDLLIVLMHGITAMHLANEPEQPVDRGRFGSLIPIVLDLLENSWTKNS